MGALALIIVPLAVVLVMGREKSFWLALALFGALGFGLVTLLSATGDEWQPPKAFQQGTKRVPLSAGWGR